MLVKRVGGALQQMMQLNLESYPRQEIVYLIGAY